MRKILLIAMALCLLPALSARAQLRDPGSRAELVGVPPGMVHVDANYLAPNSCRYFASMRQGAPAAAHVPRNAIALTVVVATASGPCHRQPTVVRNVATIFPDLTTVNVVVYFISPSGKQLKREQIPIAGL